MDQTESTQSTNSEEPLPSSPVPLRSTNSDSKKWTLWAAASYAFVMLVIGLPLWLKTTSVVRVPLPYDEMLTLNDMLAERLRITITIHLKGFTVSAEELTTINNNFQSKGNQNTVFIYKLWDLTSAEKNILDTSKTLDDIDARLCGAGDDGESDLYIFQVNRASFMQHERETKVVLGNCKSIYYISGSTKIKMEELWKVLDQFSAPSMNGEELVGANSNDFQLPLSAGYDILWSLLIPEPELVDASWKIENAVKQYMSPLLRKLEPFAEFTLRSQYLYYVKLNVKPKFNAKTSTYEIPYEQLPLVINPVESKLTSFVSQHPALNFLVYLSPCDVSPMQILNEEGTGFVESNSFFVPRWGGIQVHNAPCPGNTTEQGTGKHQIFMDNVMAICISQFRSLIGVQEMSSGTNVLNFYGSAIRDWEADLIIRKRLAALLFTASNTLKSLGNLLDQITNIVVREQVGQEVEKSVESLKKSFEASAQGKLKLAQRYAIEAFKSSEIAFHHPSNLAQLYFPDDQKYAIYIPLFLPVGIPVLLSLRLIATELLSWYKGEPAKSKVE